MSAARPHDLPRAPKKRLRLASFGDSPPQSMRDGEVATRRAKTVVPAFWPVPGPLDAVLRAAPAHSAVTLCASSTGRPWTVNGFHASWRGCASVSRNKARPGRTSRSTGFAIKSRSFFAKQDMTSTIADALGQRTIEMARHYAKGIDSAGRCPASWRHPIGSWNRRRTKSVKPG